MADNANRTTIIGADTRINGEMTCNSSAQINGTVEGSIDGQGDIQVTETAECRAAIEAKRITIDGAVEGNVTAHERAQLNSKARLQGDLIAPKLVIDEGANFVGHCRVGPDVGKGASVAEAKPAAKAQPVGAK